MSRCPTCRAYMPPRDGTPGFCRNLQSKRGTFVVSQPKFVRDDYGCVFHEPRVPAQAQLFPVAAA
jgi:hypothetical protein